MPYLISAVLIFFAVYPLGKLIHLLFIKSPLLSENIAESLGLGLLFFSWEVFIIGFFGNLTLVKPLILIQSCLLWFLLVKKVSLYFKPKITPSGLAVAIVILFSAYISSLLTVPFGRLKAEGIILPEGHFVDSTLHLSLMRSLARSIPPENPLFLDQPLLNYHYFIDLQMVGLAHLTGLNYADFYFGLAGPMYFFLLASVSYGLGYFLTQKKWGGVLACLLVTVSGNSYYLAPLFSSASSVTPSVAWVDFFSSKGINYSLAFSLTIVIIFWRWLERSATKWQAALMMGLIACSLAVLKVHNALIVTATLLGVGTLLIFKKNYQLFTSGLIAAALTPVLLKRLSPEAGSLLQFQPLWFIKVMYEAPDRLNFPEWELKRQYLISVSSRLGIIKLYIQGLIAFFVLNLGPLLTGSFVLFFQRRLALLAIVISMLFSIVATHSLTLRPTAIVTIQFFYITHVALSLLSAFLVSSLLPKWKFSSVLLGVLVWSLMLPGVRFTTQRFLSRLSVPDTSPKQVELISQLNKLPSGRLLTDPTYWAGSLIPAYTDHIVFVGDLWTLDSQGVDQSTRRHLTTEMFSCNLDPESVQNTLSQYRINYIISSSPIVCKGYDNIFELTVTGLYRVKI